MWWHAHCSTWIDSFQASPSFDRFLLLTWLLPVPAKQNFEAQLYALSMDLYEHKLKTAHQLSASLLSFSHSFHV